VRELDRSRGLAEIINDAFALFLARFWTYVAIAAVVAVPVQLAIFGIGLGELTSRYDGETTQGETLLVAGVQLLLITPLISAMVLQALVDPRRSTWASIQAGMDLFIAVVVVSGLFAALFVAGLFALIVPGIIVLVRLFAVVQVVVLEDRRGLEALRRSWALTAGTFWRTLGITILTRLIPGVVGGIVSLPFLYAAEQADAQVLVLVGSILGNVISLPPAIIGATLLFYDLRRRQDPPRFLPPV
jgi:hypothetical protein